MTEVDPTYDEKVREWIRIWTTPLNLDELALIVAELMEIRDQLGDRA